MTSSGDKTSASVDPRSLWWRKNGGISSVRFSLIARKTVSIKPRILIIIIRYYYTIFLAINKKVDLLNTVSKKGRWGILWKSRVPKNVFLRWMRCCKSSKTTVYYCRKLKNIFFTFEYSIINGQKGQTNRCVKNNFKSLDVAIWLKDYKLNTCLIVWAPNKNGD